MKNPLPWIVAVAVLGCDRTADVAGGTTTDTDNALAFQVVDQVGKPQAQALASLWPSDWGGDTLNNGSAKAPHSLQADTAGRIFLKDLPPGRWQLEIHSQSNGARVPVEIFRGTRIELGKVTVTPLGGLVGRVEKPNPGQRNWVWLRGSGHMVATDSLGIFRLDGIPSGNWSLEALVPDSPKQPSPIIALVESGERTSGIRFSEPALLTASKDSLLLWNFDNQLEAGTSYLCKTVGPGCGLWLPSLDTVRNGAWSKTSQRVLPNVRNKIKLSDLGTFADLSRMDSLTMMVRGPGRIRVIFHSRIVNDGEGRMMTIINLATGWQRLVLRSEDIVPEPGTISDSLGRTWFDIRSGINEISFDSRSYADKLPDTLLLDEIVMHGRKLDSLRAE